MCNKMSPISIPLTAVTNILLSALMLLVHIKLIWVFIYKIITHKSAQIQETNY